MNAQFRWLFPDARNTPRSRRLFKVLSDSWEHLLAEYALEDAILYRRGSELEMNGVIAEVRLQVARRNIMGGTILWRFREFAIRQLALTLAAEHRTRKDSASWERQLSLELGLLDPRRHPMDPPRRRQKQWKGRLPHRPPEERE